MDISRGHIDGDEQAQGIHQHVPLPTLDMLMSIISRDARRFLNRFDTLGIHDRGAWVWIPTDSFSFSFSQRGEQAGPDAFETQASKVVEDRLPRREVLWQVAPRTTCAQNVEDGIKNRS
ncbi:hypothetical protein ccbrp13_06150 [Ktedonobacteria bacterium brp13]|nr:hypothetical protein ccbrp13_06150 [Ktedonobacteria bacterium brp13]